MTSPPIFDGHNDLILRLLRGTATPEGVAAGLEGGHIDLPRAQAGGFGGGFFAIYVPSPVDKDAKAEEMSHPSYDLPLPAQIPQPEALRITLEGADALEALEAAGALTICRTVAELEAAIHAPKMAAIMHIEGAEAIDPEFEILHQMHARGLRSLGPVWSRPTIFGNGVPFRFPSTGDIGDGLSEHGKRLVAECNALKIMIDLSHLNEKGMDDVAAISDAPLVATHSNAYAVTPHSRNLTDRQLAQIAQSDGMVGINFASAFLRPDGQMDSDFSLDVMMSHLDHLVKILGEDRVGFGSDFDGALVPKDIGSVAGLPALRQAMIDHGIGDEMMEKLCYRNWLRVLRKTWGA
ncbi:dipeptidase [Salipiger sp. 1_MG-2023]|uniref:dipeptidase n=1 Tax=Salipiger sp. 1_MG-2023 TaxID=3062665 RepID=UPI0026E3CD5E|nr:dipeptidase [Salipiger sp. 1_MG-2023]MDO6588099.1 dipeptidase [Salipiger sp. 1_MG-2023]